MQNLSITVRKNRVKWVLIQLGNILNELDGSFVGTGTAANFAGATSMTMMMALHTGENGENGS